IWLGVDLEPDEWTKDSGCSKHITGNRKLFSTYKAYNGGNIIFGSNLCGNIIGKGQICDNKCRVTFSKHDSEITKDGKVVGRGRQDNAIDEDVDEQPVQDLADDYNAFDSDVDEAPKAQTMFMANLSSTDLVYDEAGPSYDSDILSEVHDHDHYQDAVFEHHEEHEMHDDV
ncbi:hypothetical protein Tco_0754300, partial [Tanacetum coccineum]